MLRTRARKRSNPSFRSTDSRAEQIREGEACVIDYIQKDRPDFAARVNALAWGQSREASDRSLHCLVLWRREQRDTVQFTEEELIELVLGDSNRALAKVDDYFRALR